MNEKPTAQEQQLALGQAKQGKIAYNAIIHTTMGDIHIHLFPDEFCSVPGKGVSEGGWGNQMGR